MHNCHWTHELIKLMHNTSEWLKWLSIAQHGTVLKLSWCCIYTYNLNISIAPGSHLITKSKSHVLSRVCACALFSCFPFVTVTLSESSFTMLDTSNWTNEQLKTLLSLPAHIRLPIVQGKVSSSEFPDALVGIPISVRLFQLSIVMYWIWFRHYPLLLPLLLLLSLLLTRWFQQKQWYESVFPSIYLPC